MAKCILQLYSFLNCNAIQFIVESFRFYFYLHAPTKKYIATDFMEHEISLFLAALNFTSMSNRNCFEKKLTIKSVL